MSTFAPVDKQVYLLFGKNGWIGGKLIELLKAQGKTLHIADSRTYNREAVEAEIEKYQPTHVLNAAGVTGRPNVDWCEDNKAETIRSNVIGTLNVADICNQKGIHHLLYATGCIFEYDDAHTIGGAGFKETDAANFHKSFYSHTKVGSAQCTLTTISFLKLISVVSPLTQPGPCGGSSGPVSHHLHPACAHAHL